MDNQTIAHRLSDYATELYGEQSNLYRVRAYRWAAQTVRTLEQSLEEVLAKEGSAGLAALPGIGSHLAFTIAELIRTGEAVFKEKFAGNTLSDEEWLDAIVAHPVLIERPIVVRGDKAIVARPAEKVLELL